MDNTHTVLIVEDDNALLQTLRRVVEARDTQVETAESGTHAIALLEKKPDLILLDLLMSDTDGYGVLEHMKEHSIDIPVIVLTNLSDDFNRQKCVEYGCKDYLVKSDLDEADIWPIIEHYL